MKWDSSINFFLPTGQQISLSKKAAFGIYTKDFTKCVYLPGIGTISVSSSDHYEQKPTTQKIKSNIYTALFKISIAKRIHGFLSCKPRMATTYDSSTSVLALVATSRLDL